MTPVMRLPHLVPFARSPLYFFTVCAASRRQILANRIATNALTRFWQTSHVVDGWFVGRYVIMPDHVHLFARPAPDAKPCSRWVKAWKSVSARTIAAELSIEPPIWQADYFDHFVRSLKSYRGKWNYVCQNPVRKGLVSMPEDWPWSGVIHDLEFVA